MYIDIWNTSQRNKSPSKSIDDFNITNWRLPLSGRGTVRKTGDTLPLVRLEGRDSPGVRSERKGPTEEESVDLSQSRLWPVQKTFLGLRRSVDEEGQRRDVNRRPSRTDTKSCLWCLEMSQETGTTSTSDRNASLDSGVDQSDVHEPPPLSSLSK